MTKCPTPAHEDRAGERRAARTEAADDLGDTLTR
jgi:hypothetical protein